MFGIILNLVATLMHGYLTWRIGSLRCFNAARRRRRLWLFSVTLWLLYLAAIQLGHDNSGAIVSLLERLSLDWLGALFIATTVMLALDLLTGFGLWAKPYLNHLRRGALMLALLFISVALVQGTSEPVVVRHQVAMNALPKALDGTRMVVLSDLHLGSQFKADWLAERVAQIEGLKPDIIVLLGCEYLGSDEKLLVFRFRPSP